MMDRIEFVGLLVLWGAVGGCGDSTISKPSPEISPAARTRTILNRLESVEYMTIQSDIVYRVTSLKLGDSEIRTGRIAFQKELVKNGEVVSPAKARITFATLQHGRDRQIIRSVDYVVDGERLKLGKGLFPIPFGQKAKYITDLFEVTTREQVRTDPKNTYCIKLVPRFSHKKDVNFIFLRMWIDNNTDLPVRLISKDINKNITVLTFSKMKTQNKIDPELFGKQ